MKTLFVGIGSAHGDDQIGWRVADMVAKMIVKLPGAEHWEIRKAKSPIELLAWLDDVTKLVVCDACRCDPSIDILENGDICFWRWPNDDLFKQHFSGSHDLGLVSVLDLGGKLGQLPKNVYICAVPIESAEPTAEMSDDLVDSCSAIARRILRRHG